MSPDFLHMVIMKRKDKSVTNIFSWVWLGIPTTPKLWKLSMGKGHLRGGVRLWTVQNQRFVFISESAGVLFFSIGLKIWVFLS